MEPHGAAGRRVRVGWRLPAWWLTTIKLGLGCLVVGELVALLLIATKPMPSMSMDVRQADTPNQQSQQPPGEPMISLAAVAARPLFQAASHPIVLTRTQASATSSAQAKAVADRLSLIGIVSGTPPHAIIEDAQAKKTHLVTVGQELIEGLIVEDIQPDRVVLDLNGENIELTF